MNNPEKLSSSPIYLPIRLNPRKGHQMGSGEQSAGVSFCCFCYAPNFEKVGSILLSACDFVRLSVRPFKTEFKLGF